jgi:hypothetical protein
VKILVGETDRILDVHSIGALSNVAPLCGSRCHRSGPFLSYFILGPNAGEMIAEGVLALEYGVSSKEIVLSLCAQQLYTELRRLRIVRIMDLSTV